MNEARLSRRVMLRGAWLTAVGLTPLAACGSRPFVSPVAPIATEPADATPLPATTPSATPEDCATLRATWRAMLTGGAYDPADPDIARQIDRLTDRARNYWSSLERGAGRTALWPDRADPAGAQHIAKSFGRLKAMALAYAAVGSSLGGDPALRDDILGGLDWLYADRYNERVTPRGPAGGWWYWEIGAPLDLLDTLTLLYDHLSADQLNGWLTAVDHFTPAVKWTGANRVWTAAVVAMRGLIGDADAKLTAARDGLTAVFSFVTGGDGFYGDGSFIQHDRNPYNGGYGASLLAALAPLLALLHGSPWAIVDLNLANVYRWVDDAFAPLLYEGLMMDMVRGREISRPRMADRQAGNIIIGACLRLAQASPPAEALALNRLVKQCLQADAGGSFLKSAPIAGIVQAKAVLADAAITPLEPVVRHKHYPAMDRVVYRRPDFGIGLSMSSSRIYNYESVNGENLRGWYTGAGMLLLYTGNLGHYGDNYWATVDPYRLPGTTVEAHSRAPASGQSWLSDAAWVGGVNLSERYGVAGMDLRGWQSSLSARKAWFFFDDEVVALGAGITSADGRDIVTTVENRRLNERGDDPLTVDGAPMPTDPGWAETLAGVTWAHLEGVGGYYFPGAATVRGRREVREGAWKEINAVYGSAERVAHPYLTFWLDHGRDPRDEGYAYVLLPAKTAAATAAYGADPDVAVLANTSAVQAAEERRLGLIGIAFWEAGSLGDIQVSGPAAVMTETAGSILTVAVADPTQRQATLRLEVACAGRAVVAQDRAVALVQLAPTIVVEIDLTQTPGASHAAIFELAGD